MVRTDFRDSLKGEIKFCLFIPHVKSKLCRSDLVQQRKIRVYTKNDISLCTPKRNPIPSRVHWHYPILVSHEGIFGLATARQDVYWIATRCNPTSKGGLLMEFPSIPSSSG